DNAGKIKASCIAGKGLSASKTVRSGPKELEEMERLLSNNDYNAERSRIAVRGAKSFLAPYEQFLCERRKKAKQQTLEVFFKSTHKKQSKDTEPQPSTSGIGRFFVPTMQPKLHLMTIVLMMTMTTLN
ncbi:putative Tigger transposable element-derived protein 1-like 327, partial [Homarus americanus]